MGFSASQITEKWRVIVLGILFVGVMLGFCWLF